MTVAQEPPHYLAMRLRDALAHDSRVSELDLHVKIVGDRVFVSGVVSSEACRQAISDVATEVLPTHRLVNETSVLEAASTPKTEDIG